MALASYWIQLLTGKSVPCLTLISVNTHSNEVWSFGICIVQWILLCKGGDISRDYVGISKTPEGKSFSYLLKLIIRSPAWMFLFFLALYGIDFYKNYNTNKTQLSKERKFKSFLQKNCGIVRAKAYKGKVYVPRSELVQDFCKLLFRSTGMILGRWLCIYHSQKWRKCKKKKKWTEFISFHQFTSHLLQFPFQVLIRLKVYFVTFHSLIPCFISSPGYSELIDRPCRIDDGAKLLDFRDLISCCHIIHLSTSWEECFNETYETNETLVGIVQKDKTTAC